MTGRQGENQGKDGKFTHAVTPVEHRPTAPVPPAHNPCADMPNLVRVTTPEGSQAWMEETVRSDDAAEVFGDAQVGGTYSYRMVFDNGDGTFRVLDRSWGAVTVDSQGFVSSTEVDDVRTTCHDSTTVCTDPSDPGGTEISSDVEDDGDTWSRESMRFWFKDASLDALKVEALKTAKQRCEQDLAASKGLLESHGVSGW